MAEAFLKASAHLVRSAAAWGWSLTISVAQTKRGCSWLETGSDSTPVFWVLVFLLVGPPNTFFRDFAPEVILDFCESFCLKHPGSIRNIIFLPGRHCFFTWLVSLFVWESLIPVSAGVNLERGDYLTIVAIKIINYNLNRNYYLVLKVNGENVLIYY